MAVPAHPPFPDAAMLTDSDEELSDEQVRELLIEAEQRMQNAQTDADTQIKLPKLNAGQIARPYLHTKGSITRVDASQVADTKDKSLAGTIKKIEDPVKIKKQRQEEKKATAGPDWFNLPKTDMTPELRRDLQLLKMRGVIDPKRHYKKDGKSDIPTYSAVGTIIEGPTEFYSARLQNKDRKRTFVEEVLAQESETGRFKKKYNEIQTTKASGKKAFYKALKAKRKGRVEKR